MMSEGLTWFAMGFGLGQSPVLPGTVGALPGVLLAWLILRWPRRVQLFATMSLIILAVPLCDVASRVLGGMDDKRIVADEFLGFPVAVIGQPAARKSLVLASVFLVSRILDGLKPPPAAQAESIPGGLGIVLDDLAANLYAWLLLAGTSWIYYRWKGTKAIRRR